MNSVSLLINSRRSKAHVLFLSFLAQCFALAQNGCLRNAICMKQIWIFLPNIL